MAATGIEAKLSHNVTRSLSTKNVLPLVLCLLSQPRTPLSRSTRRDPRRRCRRDAGERLARGARARRHGGRASQRADGACTAQPVARGELFEVGAAEAPHARHSRVRRAVEARTRGSGGRRASRARRVCDFCPSALRRSWRWTPPTRARSRRMRASGSRARRRATRTACAR